MKNSINKGFLTYLFLFIGILLGVVLVCMSIMLFSPGTSVLGFTYIDAGQRYQIKTIDGDDGTILLDKDGKQITAKTADMDYYELNDFANLVIKTNYSSVAFVSGDQNQIDVVTTVKAFCKTKDLKPVSVTKSYNPVTQTFEIVVNDSDYTLITNDKRHVVVYLTEENYENLNISVETKEANIQFGGALDGEPQNHKFHRIEAKAEKGDISVTNYIKIQETINLVVRETYGDSTLNLYTKEGNISVGENVVKDLGVHTVSLVKLQVGNGDIKTNGIVATKVEIVAERCDAEIGNVIGNVEISAKDGLLSFGSIIGNLIDKNEVVRNLQVTANSVSGNVTIPKATSSNMSFDSIGGDAMIKTEAGSITIKSLSGKGELVTTTGNVNLLCGVANASTLAITTNSGDIDVKFQNLENTKTITSIKGNVNVLYKEGLVFKLVATGKKVELKNQNITEEDTTVTGYPGKGDAEVTTDDVLTITTQANITVEKNATVVFA